MAGGDKAGAAVVGDGAGNDDFRAVVGDIDHRDALGAQPLREAQDSGVVAQRDDGAVAAPPARGADEAVRKGEPPSMLPRKAADALEPRRYRRIDHQQDMAMSRRPHPRPRFQDRGVNAIFVHFHV